MWKWKKQEWARQKKNNNKLRKLVETKSNITEFYMSMKKNR